MVDDFEISLREGCENSNPEIRLEIQEIQ